jgi:CDGSH-type Zn-finger protein
VGVVIVRIKVTTNGPYLVSGNVPLSEQKIGLDEDGDCRGWEAGRRYETDETYALCRCGQSRNKPFCDGAHEQAGFDGTETASTASFEEQATDIEGPDLTLADAKALCAGARFCHRDRGTWDLVGEPSGASDRQTAIEEIWDCPSGRLVAREKDGRPIEPDLEPSIGLVEDTQFDALGPIWVRGGIPVESATGETYEIRNRVTLCRCGRSSNKPFCDGSHTE